MNDQGQNAPSIGAIFQESVDEVVDAVRRAAPKLRQNARKYAEHQLRAAVNRAVIFARSRQR